MHELRDCSVLLKTMDQAARYLARHREQAPLIGSLARPLEGLSRLRSLMLSLDSAIHPDGSISESATPELRRLTHHAHELKQTIRHKLEQILHSQRYADVLQEGYFAQREGRYVVPVKVEMQGRVPGILHDVSASGATVFLEPRELVELNNAIKVADLEIDREVRRILQGVVRAGSPRGRRHRDHVGRTRRTGLHRCEGCPEPAVGCACGIPQRTRPDHAAAGSTSPSGPGEG